MQRESVHPPEETLRLLAKAKGYNCHFEDIWPKAIQAAVKEARWDQKKEWREAITETKSEWQAAYEGRSTPLSTALQGLARVPD